VDLRDFVTDCLAAGTGKVIDTAISCSDIPVAVNREEREANRVLVFEQIIGCQAAVVANLFGDRRRICKAGGTESLPEFYRKVDAAIAHPAPLRTAVWEKEDYEVIAFPKLTQLLPNLQYSRDDATPYLTSGIVMVEDPEFDRIHLCFVRLSLQPDDTLLFNAATANIGRIVNGTVGNGQELPIVILIGPPVELILSSCLSIPKTAGKLQVAQSLAGGNLSFSDDRLPLPLGTEYILKGRICPEYRKEGPFGDMKGLYAMKERNPVCRLDELCQRRKPKYHSISAGTSKEHISLVSLGPGYRLFKLSATCDGIVRFDIPVSVAGRMAVITVREGFDPVEILNHLWQIPIIRLFIFVNEDVDETSLSDLFWAIIHRTEGLADFHFTDSKSGVMKETKIAIDATVSHPNDWTHRRVTVYRQPG